MEADKSCEGNACQVSKDKLKDFIEKLKTIGMIEDKVSDETTVAQQVSVVIEIRQN